MENRGTNTHTGQISPRSSDKQKCDELAGGDGGGDVVAKAGSQERVERGIGTDTIKRKKKEKGQR
jgi:hypothetical protein